jgi:hypothetical protein
MTCVAKPHMVSPRTMPVEYSADAGVSDRAELKRLTDLHFRNRSFAIRLEYVFLGPGEVP